MAMIPLARCEALAKAEMVDRSSAEFKNALGTLSALIKRGAQYERLERLKGLQTALQAHGTPIHTPRPRMDPAALSAVRSEASVRGLVARAKATLMRRITASKTGMVIVSDQRPAIFDAALELIEDGTLRCILEKHETVRPGPVPKGGLPTRRKVLVADEHAKLPDWAVPMEATFKSRRRQEGERI